MDKELLYSITINNYIRKVKLADSRRAKYFKPGESIPRKYLGDNFIWKEAKLSKKRVENRLYDIISETFVIKNPKVAGTERWEVINGQKIYNQGYHPFVRQKIMEQIHLSFVPYLVDLKIDKFPLFIECEIHDLEIDPISRGQYWDVFNRAYPYCKAFEDVLQKCKVIPDDDYRYITCPSHPIFYPLKEGNPKLVFNIYSVNGNTGTTTSSSS